MFNTYNADNSSNTQTTKINAVSGTIVKSHMKSWIKRFHINSDYADEILSKEPTILIERIADGYDMAGRIIYKDTRIKVVVLQVMLACDGWVIAEIIKKEDLEEE